MLAVDTLPPALAAALKREGVVLFPHTLGVGASGTTILGQFKGALAAIKLTLTHNPGEAAQAQHEGDLALKIGTRPHVIGGLRHWAEPPYHILIMPYFQGSNLAEVLKARNGTFLPLDEVVKWAQQLLDGAEVLWQLGIVHRDIKGENMLVDGARQLHLLDFNISKVIAAGTAFGQGQGTPGWAAPEQSKPGTGTIALDMHALGATVYELASLKEPPALVDRAGAPISLRKVRPGLPEVFYRWIEKATAWFPEDRFQTADEARQALQTIMVPLPRKPSAPKVAPIPAAAPVPASVVRNGWMRMDPRVLWHLFFGSSIALGKKKLSGLDRFVFFVAAIGLMASAAACGGFLAQAWTGAADALAHAWLCALGLEVLFVWRSLRTPIFRRRYMDDFSRWLTLFLATIFECAVVWVGLGWWTTPPYDFKGTALTEALVSLGSTLLCYYLLELALN